MLVLGLVTLVHSTRKGQSALAKSGKGTGVQGKTMKLLINPSMVPQITSMSPSSMANMSLSPWTYRCGSGEKPRGPSMAFFICGFALLVLKKKRSQQSDVFSPSETPMWRLGCPRGFPMLTARPLAVWACREMVRIFHWRLNPSTTRSWSCTGEALEVQLWMLVIFLSIFSLCFWFCFLC